MRKITLEIVTAFEGRYSKSLGNTRTDGESLFLHDNEIAKWVIEPNGELELYISSCGWESTTTKERLNGIDGVSITQKDFVWYLNGVEWRNSDVMTCVSSHRIKPTPTVATVDGVEYTPAPVDGVEWCKGCGHKLRTPAVLNALSRYEHGYICSDCGIRESMQGDFISK